MGKRLSIFHLLSITFLCLSNSVGQDKIPVAGITTLYQRNTHADVLMGRILETDTLDGNGRASRLSLGSLYVDQVREGDMSRSLSRKHSFSLFDQAGKTLIRRDGKLAVKGVVLVAEHGDYPLSDSGQVVYPKRRLFNEVFQALDRGQEAIPIFSDKHLADNWEDARWIYDAAQQRKVPLMAGSSVPSAWRYPPADVRRGAELKEIVAVGYGPMDAYGFHALEMMQSLAERRKGGETGVARVRCLRGEKVWKEGQFDRTLLDEALGRLKDYPLPPGKRIEELVKNPILFVVEYRDGLQASVLMLSGPVREFASAWRYEDQEETQSTLFWLQPVRPFHHFAHLLRGIEQFMESGQAPWPVERTLLTTGLLDALHISDNKGGKWLDTPYLGVQYESEWDWVQPPPPPPEEE